MKGLKKSFEYMLLKSHDDNENWCEHLDYKWVYLFGEKSLKTLIQVRMVLKLSNIGCPLIEPQIKFRKV